VATIAYGSLTYGSRTYGGTGNSEVTLIQGVFVTVYDNLGNYIASYQTGVGDFLSAEFVLDESGCREFAISFSAFVAIQKQHLVTIKIFDNPDVFFKGVVREIPISGSTETDYIYRGFGLNDYLIRANTGDKTYAEETISDILDDLIDDLAEKTPVNKNASKIATIDTEITEINFKYINYKEALDQLQKIANADGNDYLTGIDEQGEFFFWPRNTSVVATLIVGKYGKYGIADYVPEESDEPISKIYVLDKDGNYVDAYSSENDMDLFEKKLTAPDIDVDDIPNWARGQLKTLEVQSKQATVEWQIEKFSPLLLKADGYIRIISNVPPTNKDWSDSTFGDGEVSDDLFGGIAYSGKDVDDTLSVKEVSYNIKDGAAHRKIQLGSIPISLDAEIINVNKNVEALRISTGR